MSPCLEDCPVEIVENVVLQLGLDDIRSLRQSCRSLATKCSQDHFKSFFLSKRVEVTEQTLRVFAEVTQPGRLGCLLRELTLIGITDNARGNDLGTQKISRKEEIELLSQAFCGLATNSETGRLLSLSLEVAVASGAGERLLPAAAPRVDKRLVWRSAADTFDAALDALAASKLPIERLNIFNSRQMQRCSLACNRLSKIDWENPGLATSFASIRSLSVSLSNRILGEPESGDDGQGNNDKGPVPPKRKDENDLQAEAEDESNFVSLANLFQLCNQLTDFEIHYCRFSHAPLEHEDLHHERLLQRVVELDKLPILKCCRLRGVYTREEDLLLFIERTRVCELAMENVNLCSGTFRSIFDHCLSETTSIQAVYFDDLHEQWSLICFDTPDEPDLEFINGTSGCSTLQRTGGEVKQPISYLVPQSRLISSPATSDRTRRRRREYWPA
jgi:hypothetical protein